MISLLLAQQHDEPLNGATYTAVVERCFARRTAGHIVWSESVSPYCWAQSLARRAAAWNESVSPCCWSHRVVFPGGGALHVVLLVTSCGARASRRTAGHSPWHVVLLLGTRASRRAAGHIVWFPG